jgi:hypothetical protein
VLGSRGEGELVAGFQLELPRLEEELLHRLSRLHCGEDTVIDWMQEAKRLVQRLGWLQDRATDMNLPVVFAQPRFSVVDECPDPKREVAIQCERRDGGTGVVAMGGFRTTVKQSSSELWEVGVELDRPSVVWEHPEIDHELDWRSIRWDLTTHAAAIEIAMTFARDLIAEKIGLSESPIGRDGLRLRWPE